MDTNTFWGATSAVFAVAWSKVASLLGALVPLMFSTRLKFWSAVVTVIFGTLTSHYLTEIIIHFYPSALEIRDPIAFFMGVGGWKVLEGVLVRFDKFKREDLTVKDIVEDVKTVQSLRVISDK